MTILESLREKKARLKTYTTTSEDLDLINAYDLSLENALLKLGNRSTQIKDLKCRANIEAGNINEVIGKVLAWVENEEKGREIINMLQGIQDKLRR